MLYPLLFENNFHRLVWGGTRLKPMKGVPADNEPIGESWEISAVPSSKSVVKNGSFAGKTLNELVEQYKEEFLGRSVYERYGNNFPLLIKYIDAAKDLSVQVHPNNEMAKAVHNSLGKSELWYIMKAEPNAKIYVGFKSPISQYEYEKRIEDGSICEVLQEHYVKPGDVFYIPAGRVHAICGGIMLAEIQQSSDLTYRIFDYNRPGLDGKPRELHTELAKEALDYSVYPNYHVEYNSVINKPIPLEVNEIFSIKLLQVNRAFHRKLYKYDSFVIYMCLEGNAIITLRDTKESITLTEGNSCLIPAGVADFDVAPNNSSGITKLLEVYIDNKNFN
ncbi:MAG: class I mannose-6-phosphate isomerase [Odoribacter sp.]|nr:class I mannose-6-phosphate isomerase [Odoribacter sp.]